MMLRRRWKELAAVVAVALVITGCSAQPEPAETDAGPTSITLSSVAPPGGFDPVNSQGAPTYMFYQPVYDTLLRAKPDGTLVPMLATKWAYSQANTVLSLTLKKGVKFTDGTAFDATVAKANLERFKTSSATDAATLSGITDITASGDDTLKITLAQADPAFLVYLTTAAAFQASPASFKDPNLKTTPNGTGPYTLDKDKTVVGATYTYQKNTKYWDPSLIKYDTIVIKVLADATARVNAVKSGQVDFTTISNVADVPAVESVSSLKITRHAVNWFGLNFFDRAGKLNPALADVRVRQAINYAIDTKGILKALGAGDGTLTSQIFPSTSDAYLKSLDNAYPFNPTKAKSLLKDAGFATGLTINMASTSGLIDPSFFTTVRQSLADVGVTVNLTQFPLADYTGALLKGSYPMALFLFGQASDWEIVSQYIAPNARWNVFKLQDPKVTELMKTIQTGSGDTRKTALQNLNKYVVDQAWFGPWYRPDLFYATSAKVAFSPQAGRAAPYIYNFAPKGK